MLSTKCLKGVTRLQRCIDWGQTIVRYFSLWCFFSF